MHTRRHVQHGVFPASVCVLILHVFEITNGRWKTLVTVRIVNAETDLAGDPQPAVGEQGPTELDLADPLQVVEVAVAVVADFTAAGLYLCQIVSNEEIIASRRIVVRANTQEIGP